MSEPRSSSNSSKLKEFLAGIATIQGDLSNITAPPFVLATYSTVELPQYWADHPSLFAAPGLEPDPQKRALLVLKWFLGSLRNQQYGGRGEHESVKKPLNAFLGELFLGSFPDEEVGETRLIAEQVSHHPPVTACYLFNEQSGIRAEGFTQQEITFSGSVSIKQKGYAVLHVDRYEEDYLIPVPKVKVRGVLSGAPYPEVMGTYSIISSNGLVSRIEFEGKGVLNGGSKHAFDARVYRADAHDDVLYTAKGQWNGRFSIVDARTEVVVDSLDVNALRTVPLHVADLSAQDPWESRRAWSGVIEALTRGDMKGTVEAKSVVEKGQRQIRQDAEARGEEWQQVFFHRQDHDLLFEKLSAVDKNSYTVDPEGGIWKADREAAKNTQKPYHGSLLPTGQMSKDQNIRSTNGDENRGTKDVKMEHQEGAEVLNGTDRESSPHPTAREQATGEESAKRIQIEELLRAKYSSTHR